MSKVQLIKVKESDDGMRLNRWFLKYYPDLPLSRLNKLLRTKQIKVDGKKAEAAFKLLGGQEARVPPMEETADPARIPRRQVAKEFLPPLKRGGGISEKDVEFIQKMVIYKDDNIIVLNKPSGIAVQGGTKTERHIDGMLEGLRFGNEESPKLVHRIDKDTSGILVLARNRKYAEILTRAFRERDLPKTYLALVSGVPSRPNGEIKAALEKVGEKSIAVDGGKKAVTIYKVLESAGESFALIEAKPLTGRTHQIRAHLELLGTPIVGDDKYFGAGRKRFNLLADKLHLHAYKIDLSEVVGKRLEITAPLPGFFAKDLESLGFKI